MSRLLIHIDGPTTVYRLYCAHGSVLYVGIAANLRRRLGQHASTKPWWPEVRAVVADEYATRREALAVEAAYIKALRPWHNIAGKPDDFPVPGQRVSEAVYAVHDGELYDIDTAQRVI